MYDRDFTIDEYGKGSRNVSRYATLRGIEALLLKDSTSAIENGD